ncbi:MAG: hypothetical protein U0531_04285 [Dehalococcoidia bacterium]
MEEEDPLICDDQGLVIHLRGKGLVVLSSLRPRRHHQHGHPRPDHNPG